MYFNNSSLSAETFIRLVSNYISLIIMYNGLKPVPPRYPCSP